MEGEVPNAWIGAEAIEHGRPRQRRVHHHQTRYLVPIGLSIGIGDHQSDIVADQRDWVFDPEVLSQ